MRTEDQASNKLQKLIYLLFIICCSQGL